MKYEKHFVDLFDTQACAAFSVNDLIDFWY